MFECSTPVQPSQFTVLIVDDEPDVLRSLRRYLVRSGYQLLFAEDGETALQLLAANVVDLMLLDLKMPGIEGMKVLEQARVMRSSLKVIIQTGYGGVHEAVQAMRQGAFDFLVKGEPVEKFQSCIRQVYENWQLKQENSASRRRNSEIFQFDDLLGESLPMQQLKKKIVRVAPTDTTVLIQGESGTGKELIAKALHYHSERNNEPLITVDCASISESILESELFGHVKGAFTGADDASLGLIRAADAGTIFLDEIGEMPISIQAKLLRTIQERHVRPVGSTTTYFTNIRIMAATNRNLIDEVARRSFRMDLFYRISQVTLTVPPLRDRGDDFVLLIRYILDQCAAVYGQSFVVSPEVFNILTRYSWPGNVRELDNVLRGAAVFCDNGIIQPHNLPPILLDRTAGEGGNNNTVESSEREAIRKALLLCGHNKKEAVKMLGISEATLYRKIKKYDL